MSGSVNFEPREYQQHAIEWILEHPAAALYLPMGLGKTASTLAAFDRLADMAEVARGLVVAPKRVAEHTWPAECRKWKQFEKLRTYTITAADLPLAGLSPASRKRLLGEAELYFIHYDLVPRLVKEFHGAWPWDFIVLDESSMVKSQDTKRFKALKKIMPKVDRIVELTGTPSPNGIEQLWSQVYLLDRGERLGRTLTAFREQFMRPGARRGNQIFEWVPRAGARDEVYARLADVAMSLRAEDWLELPEKIHNVVSVELPKAIEKKYRELEADYILNHIDEQGGGGVVEAATAAALGNKLLQLANGAVYAEDREVLHLHDEKIKALAEIAEGADTLLVAYNYRHDLERLRRAFPKARVLDGEDDVKTIDDWNAGKIQMLLTHPRSAGHGLNLQDGGSEAVWFSLTWDLELYQQWNARLHRSGQTADRVVIHHLAAKGTIDEDVMRALEGKAGEQDALLWALAQRIQKSPEA